MELVHIVQDDQRLWTSNACILIADTHSTDRSIHFSKSNFIEFPMQIKSMKFQKISKSFQFCEQFYLIRWIIERSWFDQSQTLMDYSIWRHFMRPNWLRMSKKSTMRYMVEHSLKPTIKCAHTHTQTIAYFRNKQKQSASMHSSKLHVHICVRSASLNMRTYVLP